jgi:transposase
MMMNLEGKKIFLRPGYTDMRKSITSLSYLVQSEMNLSPFDECLFIFCSKDRSSLKILYYDRNGFCLWHKKLSKDKFPWTNQSDDSKEIDLERFFWLLKGINFFGEHTEKKYLKV